MNGLDYKLPRLQIILIPKRVLKYEEGRPKELRKGRDRTSTSTLSKCVVHSCAMKYHIRLANGPQTYYGCISVIEHYERNDLYALLKSLDKGVKDRNKEKVLEDKESLDKVIEGIWKDAIKIKNDAKAVLFGISIVMGVVGTIATSGALGPASL